MKEKHKAFVEEYLKDLISGNAAIFAGAGLSVGAGYVNWRDLLRDIARDLDLDIDKEFDLISLAQYHVTKRGRAKINRRIMEEFNQDADVTENHKILARIPITTYWTTNYDTLIEDALEDFGKSPDVKSRVVQLTTTRPYRDAIVYKMHGDVNTPSEAIITKDDYQTYFQSHAPFITALSGDLISKTFLFIGFSFTDPNLDYVLSRIRIKYNNSNRLHYCFIKEVQMGDENCKTQADLDYQRRKQQLMIEDLARYSIEAILVEKYTDITEILQYLENRYKQKTVFVSGSAEDYGNWGRDKALKFVHSLSKELITKQYRIVNGFGWGIGSAVINGALEPIYNKPGKFKEDQLVLRPFPQFETGEKKLPELWHEYRHRMISYAGIAIFVFGNKVDKDGQIVNADGVKKEFDIARERGLRVIPVGVTGYMAEELHKIIMADFSTYYPHDQDIITSFENLNNVALTPSELIKNIINIIGHFNKN